MLLFTLSRTRYIDCCLTIFTRELPTLLKTIKKVTSKKSNSGLVALGNIFTATFYSYAVDDEFERVSSQLLKRTQAMLDKYRYLLFAESKVSVNSPSSSLLLLLLFVLSRIDFDLRGFGVSYPSRDLAPPQRW